MKNLKFELHQGDETSTISAVLNNEEIASIEFMDVNAGILAHIEYVEINRDYRGKGLYKMLLLAIFNVADFKRLISDNRNHYSNQIYCHWMNTEVNDDDVIELTVENEKLFFEKC